MSQITYADKVALSPQPDVADINKVTDDDMNMIKNAHNDINGTILWTNPNPTQELEEQNITLSSSDYDMMLVLFKRARDQDDLVSGTTIKGYGMRVVTIAGDGKTRRRVLNYVNSTTYTVTNAFSEDGTQINGALVPLYVIGYKTGLFNV